MAADSSRERVVSVSLVFQIFGVHVSSSMFVELNNGISIYPRSFRDRAMLVLDKAESHLGQVAIRDCGCTPL